MAGFNKKNGNGAAPSPAAGQGAGRYATKADVILQRQADISAKIDALLAAGGGSAAQSVMNKVGQECSYISKQNSTIYEKLVQENQKLRQDLSYMAMQNEQVYGKLSAMLTTLEQKIEAAGSAEIDYEKLAKTLEERSVAKDTYNGLADEVAPAADEQLTMAGYIDYEELASRISEKLAAVLVVPAPSGEPENLDELAKKIADCIPPQEVISPDYIASKVAEQIIVPQVVVGEDGEKPVEVKALVDYDELATRVAEKLNPVQEEPAEEVVAASSEQTMEYEDAPDVYVASRDMDTDALADEIARKVAALSPNDFDIIVDDEGCRSLAEAVAEKLDYDAIAARLSDKVHVTGELAVADAAETEELSSDEIASLVAEKLAANGMTEDAIADKTAAAISNYLPEVDADDIADKVAAAVIPSIATAPAIDYDAIINGVYEKIAENQADNDYDIVIDEEGLQKITDSISWKVTASTNAMLEGMDDKLAGVKGDTDYIRGAIDAEPAAVVEEASEETVPADNAALDEIKSKLDELLAIFSDEEGDTAQEEAEEENAVREEDEVAEIKAKLDEILEKLQPAEVQEASAEEAAPADSAALGEINSKLDELLSVFGDEEETEETAAEEEAEEEDEIKSKLDEILEKLQPAEEAEEAEAAEEGPDPIADELDLIHAKLDELLAALEPVEEEGEPEGEEVEEEDEVAEIKSKLDEIIEKLQPAGEQDETQADAIAADVQNIKEKLENLSARVEELLAPEEVEESEEEVEDPLAADIEAIKNGLEELRNDPAVRELQGEVAELTARIDELTKPSEEPAEEDEEIAKLREEIAEVSRQLEQIKQMIAGGTIITAAAAAAGDDENPPVEEPEQEPEPEEAEEEQLVTVSDIVDETETSEEPVDEAMENIMEDVAEQTVEGEAEPDGIPGISNGGVDFANMMKYNRSFIARIIQSSDDVKRYYGQIKNAMLAYKKVNSSIAWGAERFNKGRETIAKLKIRGKTLCLYLNLDPNEYKTSVYHQVDVSDNKSMHGTPMMVKIKSPLGVKKAIRLIDEMLAKRNGEKRVIQERDYAAMYPYETIEELIDDGLVKDVSKNR